MKKPISESRKVKMERFREDQRVAKDLHLQREREKKKRERVLDELEKKNEKLRRERERRVNGVFFPHPMVNKKRKSKRGR